MGSCSSVPVVKQERGTESQNMTRGYQQQQQQQVDASGNVKLRDMDEKNMHNLFLKNMSGLIEETKNPSPCMNPNSKRGGMATHAGVALELGLVRPNEGKTTKIGMSPQMEAILIWCQCRTREYERVKITNFTNSWSDGLAFCALIHHFFPQAFDFEKLSKDNRKQNFELAFQTGERLAGIPDFLTADDMMGMVEDNRIDPKMVFSYVQEVYRMCNDL